MPKLVKANINPRGLTINAAEINSHKVMINKIHTIIFYRNSGTDTRIRALWKSQTQVNVVYNNIYIQMS